MLFKAPSKSRLQVIQPTWVMVLRQEKESEFRNGNTAWEQLSYEVGKRILEKRRERIRLLSGPKGEHLRQVITKYPGLLNHATKEQIARYLGVSRATAYRLFTNLARK
jgi:CRP-like cAMP-binding protein